MKRLIKFLGVLAVLGGGAYLAQGRVAGYLAERARVEYESAKVERGDVIEVVNATGTVKPVRSVQVGAFVSGPIIKLNVDFNDEIKEGDLLAKIDPRLYEANVARDKATLATRNAEVARVEALLQQAKNDQARSQALRAENRRFISDTEMDQYRFTRMSLEAQLILARAAVEQAAAELKNSEANLDYTNIIAPVDGVVIDRKIDPGQTVASQFQTPELFIVAPDLRKEMHVFASVDEADIGEIRAAESAGRPVSFTVDAYPNDLFAGKIFQIRKNSTTTQNVVTYPVVVAAPNPDLKLMPGMTASLSFEVGRATGVLKVPNAALRFYPDREQVREEDRPILDGSAPPAAEPEDRQSVAETPSAADLVEARRGRDRRHVWVKDGPLLRAVAVVTGLSDSKFTELVGGDLAEGQALVTGVKAAE